MTDDPNALAYVLDALADVRRELGRIADALEARPAAANAGGTGQEWAPAPRADRSGYAPSLRLLLALQTAAPAQAFTAADLIAFAAADRPGSAALRAALAAAGVTEARALGRMLARLEAAGVLERLGREAAGVLYAVLRETRSSTAAVAPELAAGQDSGR